MRNKTTNECTVAVRKDALTELTVGEIKLIHMKRNKEILTIKVNLRGLRRKGIVRWVSKREITVMD